MFARHAPVTRTLVTLTVLASVGVRAMYGSGASASFSSSSSSGGSDDSLVFGVMDEVMTFQRGRKRRRTRSSGVGGILWTMVAMVRCVMVREYALAFGGVMEFMLATATLTRCGGELERRLGSRRFFGVVIAVRLVDAFIGRLLSLTHDASSGGAYEEDISGGMVTGPYALIFAFVAAYAEEVPALASFDVAFGMKITDKAFRYASAAALAVSVGRASAVAAMRGAFAGYVLTHGVGLAHDALYDFTPDWVARVATRLFGHRSGPVIRIRVRANAGHAATADRRVEPSDENVRLLCGMGFGEDAVRDALSRSGDDPTRASNLLLAA
jgi:hypothetical protein